MQESYGMTSRAKLSRSSTARCPLLPILRRAATCSPFANAEGEPPSTSTTLISARVATSVGLTKHHTQGTSAYPVHRMYAAALTDVAFPSATRVAFTCLWRLLRPHHMRRISYATDHTWSATLASATRLAAEAATPGRFV